MLSQLPAGRLQQGAHARQQSCALQSWMTAAQRPANASRTTHWGAEPAAEQEAVLGGGPAKKGDAAHGTQLRHLAHRTQVNGQLTLLLSSAPPCLNGTQLLRQGWGISSLHWRVEPSQPGDSTSPASL